MIGQGGGGGCWPEQQRLRGVEMLFELAQGSTLETPGIVNKEKSEPAGLSTHVARVAGCMNDRKSSER